VNIVAANVEEMDVSAGDGGVGGLFGVLREVIQHESLQALCRVAEDVACALLRGLRIALLNGGQGGEFWAGCFRSGVKGCDLGGEDLGVEEGPGRRHWGEGESGVLHAGCPVGSGFGLRSLCGHAAGPFCWCLLVFPGARQAWLLLIGRSGWSSHV
jgi:hypothetical protein